MESMEVSSQEILGWRDTGAEVTLIKPTSVKKEQYLLGRTFRINKTLKNTNK